MRKIGQLISVILALVVFCGPGGSALAAGQVTVFAAASTTNAVNDIGALFTKQTGTRWFIPLPPPPPWPSRSKTEHRPMSIISANEKWMDYLEEKEADRHGSRFDLLGNRIVLIAPVDSPMRNRIAPGFRLAGRWARTAVCPWAIRTMFRPASTAKKALENLGVGTASRISWRP